MQRLQKVLQRIEANEIGINYQLSHSLERSLEEPETKYIFLISISKSSLTIYPKMSTLYVSPCVYRKYFQIFIIYLIYIVPKPALNWTVKFLLQEENWLMASHLQQAVGQTNLWQQVSDII